MIIVGARCAGALTALCLARGGMRVLLLERGAPATDTLSTHALMRPAVHQLQRWGVLDQLRDSGAPLIRATTFHYGQDITSVPIAPRNGVPGLLAPRRWALDAALVDAARGAGAQIAFGARVCDVRRDPHGSVTGVVVKDRKGRLHSLAANLVVGADGARSTVANLVGARPTRLGHHSSATIYAYLSGLQPDWPGPMGYHWFFARRASASLIPTNEGLVCVAASVPAASVEAQMRPTPGAAHFRWLEAVSPGLADAAARASVVGKFHQFAGGRAFMRTCHGSGWALVGDAGAFRDPATAHGISDALRDAELLATAILRGTESALRTYEEQRDDIATSLFDITDKIASFEWDMDELRTLHTDFSAGMKRELAQLEQYQTEHQHLFSEQPRPTDARCA